MATSICIVENAREGGRHVQRVIKALGRRDEVEASGLPPPSPPPPPPDLVFGRFPPLPQDLGWLAPMFRCVARLAALLDRQFGFDVERAVYLAVVHRLMVSGSDRHASEWRRYFQVTGADGLTLDHAYKAMSWLGEVDRSAINAQGRVMTDAIEEALYRHRQPLLGEASVAFFDTTSLWFEGRGGATLGPTGPFEGLPAAPQPGGARHRARWR